MNDHNPRHPQNIPVRTAAALLVAAAATAAVAAPDTHLLGPTGMFAADHPTRLEVTAVEDGSPADGEIEPGEVIVGVFGERFEADARRAFAAAIDRAETREAEGVLPLMVERGDSARTAELKLRVLGRYSDTSPWDCLKTGAIVTLIADHMLASGDYKSGGSAPIGWLGLLATGEEKYIDVVRKELPLEPWYTPDTDLIDAVVAGTRDAGLVSWRWGYRLIVLSEYFLATGDETALPGVRAYALGLARGQDPAGLWGHRMATPTRNGRLPGYAQINQPSLTCYLGLLLAARCGIEHPDLAEAIAKTRTFVASYAGRGALPYGVHPPYTHVFNNNGSSATAALAMAFLGEREAAAFFAGQCAASYDTMEFGHASHYFNTLWTPMGVNVAGPAVTRAFFKRARWVYTLYRGWDGRFTYDGTSMKQCNDNGALLLNYCIPRRAVHLTGKAADRSLWLDADDADRAVAAGRIDYDALSDDELIALFGHPAPQVTRRAAWTLRDREGGFIPKLVGLLDHGTQTERISAIGFFGYECPEPWAAAQVERLGAILRDHNEAPKVRAAAADALSWRGDAAYPYYAAMLRLVVDDEPGDPLRLIDVSAGKSLVNLCDNPFEAGLVTDKDLFYAAALKLAGHKRQSARGYGMRMLRGMPAEDFGRVGDEVRHVVLNRDPTYHSYHNPGSAVQPGVFLLAELNIREGLPWTMQVLEDPSGKYGFKVRAVLQSLSAYGVHARPLFEQIRSDPKKQNWSRGKFSPSWRQLVEAVESGRKQSEELIPFEQAMRAGSR